jgi:hypothetical protein
LRFVAKRFLRDGEKGVRDVNNGLCLGEIGHHLQDNSVAHFYSAKNDFHCFIKDKCARVFTVNALLFVLNALVVVLTALLSILNALLAVSNALPSITNALVFAKIIAALILIAILSIAEIAAFVVFTRISANKALVLTEI